MKQRFGKKGSALIAVIAALCGAMPMTASAARVTVIHGINGLDLNLAEALPVDIAVNGKCALKGVTFGQSAQVELGAGSYRITVHPSTGTCSAKAVIDQTAPITAAQTRVTLIANLSDQVVPRLLAFDNSTLPSDFQRSKVTISFYNAAKDAKTTTELFYRKMSVGSGAVRANGEGGAAIGLGRAQAVRFRVLQKAEKNQKRPKVLGSASFRLTNQVAFYLVGSLNSGVKLVREDLI